jgi:hypothetical protein
VAPHPRSDTVALHRICPSSWTIAAGARTFDLLRDGHPCLMQQWSGVAWEALALGIPTIQLEIPGVFGQYPVISEPHVVFVRTPGELSKAVSLACRESQIAEARLQLREWARYWCASTGQAAVENVLECIRVAQSSRVDSPVLDSWAAAEHPFVRHSRAVEAHQQTGTTQSDPGA